MIDEAERLGDAAGLAVAQILVEEKATEMTAGAAAFTEVDTSLPN